MRQSITPTKKVLGKVRVPGEQVPAERALLLAAIAEGESRVRFVPPGALRVVQLLRSLCIDVATERDVFIVQGNGLRGLSPAEGIVDLRGWGASGLLVIAVLAGQSFTTRVKIGKQADWAEPLLSMLAAMGMEVQRENEAVYSLGKVDPVGAVHAGLDVGADEKLAVLVAGLYCKGVTQMRESSKNRNRMERFLRQRYVSVERRRTGDEYAVSLEGEQSVQPLAVEVEGDLNLAYAFMLPALALKGSQLTVERIAVRSGNIFSTCCARSVGNLSCRIWVKKPMTCTCIRAN